MTLQPEDLLLVNRDNASYKIEYQDFKDEVDVGTINYVLNGNMNIWQRYSGETGIPFVSGQAGKWCADRFHVPNQADYQQMTWSREIIEDIKFGARFALKIERGTSSATKAALLTPLVNPRFASGQTLILSYWIPQGQDIGDVNIKHRLSSFGASNNAGTVSAGEAIKENVDTGSTGTWKRISHNVEITTEATEDQIVFEVTIDLVFPGNRTAMITGIILNKGEAATENLPTDRTVDLAECSMFYQTSVSRGWYNPSTANYDESALYTFTHTNTADTYSFNFPFPLRDTASITPTVRNSRKTNAKANRMGGSYVSEDVTINSATSTGFTYNLSNNTSSHGRTFGFAWEVYAEL